MIHMAGFSKRGSSHERNEDSFELFKIQDQSQVGVISDGCSSVKHGDFASRLVTMAAIENWNENRKDELLFKRLFKDEIPFHHLGLHQKYDWGSATFGRISHNWSELRVSLYGDGVVLYKMFGCEPMIIKIEYENNTPWYPVYAYLNGIPEIWIRTIHRIHPEGSGQITAQSHSNKISLAEFRLDLDVAEVEAVTILTDGILSGSHPFSHELCDQLLEPRKGEGDWGTRMMNRFYKKFGPFEDDLTGVAWRNEE